MSSQRVTRGRDICKNLDQECDYRGLIGCKGN